MDMLELEIQELINKKREGDYWDFKQEWYSNNVDLLHDIICMANSMANRDCYIIIGVEDKTYDICGVGQEKRKNQQNVIDLLCQKPKWAGGYIPEVYVKTIRISDKEIDVIIVKQSDNTPFYLLEDYQKEKQKLFKGAIYTRKGDTNIPKTSTADLYDTELLWKRRFGLFYNPSQRAKFYLKDLENWEIAEEKGILKEEHSFLYYRPDPDYTVYFIYEDCIKEDDDLNIIEDVNDNRLGETAFYIFSFCNVSYHTEFSDRSKIILYYKNVPLYSCQIESIDEKRTNIVPPEIWIDANYVEDSFRYLMFEFVFHHLSGNYSQEAREMILRVVPLYKNEDEYERFQKFVTDHGFSREGIWDKKSEGEALKRINNTEILYNDSSATENTARFLIHHKDKVINFANPKNQRFDEITKRLKIGKMLVDWLKEWRENSSKELYDREDIER